MDTEILFRGKRKDNGEWITSRSIFTFCDDEGKIKEAYLPIDGHMIGLEYDEKHYLNIVNIFNTYFCKIDTETLGRFTGLTDKNGKRIFEGDVVRAKVFTDGKTYSSVSESGDTETIITGYIKYIEAGYKIRFADNISFVYIPLEEYLDCDCEIIGNFHDNPELIGGK